MILKRLSKGFFLIEVIIVLAIILVGLALFMKTPRFSSRHTLMTEAKKIGQLFFYFKEYAQLEKRKSIIQFNKNRKSYHTTQEEYVLPSGLFFGTHIPIKGPPSVPHAFIAEPVTFKKLKVTFYPDGTFSSGTVYISDGAATAAVTLDVGDGALPRIYLFDTSWQLCCA